jgi:tetratricopeptide (TPR) repeat protein
MNKCLLIALLVLLPFLHSKAQNIASDTPALDQPKKTLYDSIIAQAGTYLANQQFDNAKALYRKAANLKPGSTYPIKMIKQVDYRVWQNQQLQKLTVDLKRNAEINGLMSKALKAIVKKRYDTARALYEQALAMKPVKSQELFAIQKIASIDAITGKAVAKAEVKAQPAEVVKTPLVSAKPVEPALNSTKNTTKVTAPATSNFNTTNSDTKARFSADILLDGAIKAEKAKDYVQARGIYNSIITSNASATQQQFARQKIEALNGLQVKTTTTARVKNPPTEVAKKPEILAKSKDEATTQTVQQKPIEPTITTEKRKTYMDSLLQNASNVLTAKDYPLARILYNIILSSNATKEQQVFARQQIAAIDVELKKNAKKPVEQVERPKPPVTTAIAAANNKSNITTKAAEEKLQNVTNRPVAAVPAAPPVIKKPQPVKIDTIVAKSVATAKTAIVPVKNQARIKVPVATPAPAVNNQPAPTYTSSTNKENNDFAKKLLLKTPTVNIADSNNNVKLVCQAITTNGKNSFIRFLIKDEGPSQKFQIGAIQFTYIKNYGILRTLNGEVMQENSSAENESQLVYIVQTPEGVEANEAFIFEVEDKEKKNRLTVNISGAVFLGKGNLM